MKKRIIYIVILLMLSLLVLTGCQNSLWAFITNTPVEISDQNAICYEAIDSVTYVYKNNVRVRLTTMENSDSLCLNNDPNSTDAINDVWPSVLTGYFDIVRWNNDKLYIHYDNKYYEFDINSYNMPPVDEYGEPQKPTYELIEYSEDDFVKKYPDYNDYYFYSHTK